MGETDVESFTMERAEKYLSLSREVLKTIIDSLFFKMIF